MQPESVTSKIVEVLSKQSGMGVIFAAVCSYAVIHVYSDLKATNSLLLDLVRQQVAESRSVSESIRELSSKIDSKKNLETP